MTSQILPGQYIDGDWRDGTRLQVHDASTKGLTLPDLVARDIKDSYRDHVVRREVYWDGLRVTELEFSNAGYMFLERYLPGPNHRITTALCGQPGRADNAPQRWQETGRANCYDLFARVRFDKTHYTWDASKTPKVVQPLLAPR